MKRGASGFSLVEVLLALVLMGFGLLAAAPLFVYGARTSASSADFGNVGAAAVKKMELLREASYDSLTAGGSLSSNVASFFDTTDPAVTLRWTIADDATPAKVKTINVIAIATRVVHGPAKQIQFVTKRSR